MFMMLRSQMSMKLRCGYTYHLRVRAWDCVGSTVAERLFGALVGSAAATSTTPCTQHQRPREDEKKPLSVKAARWHAFAKRERPLVKQAGITGNAEVLKEVEVVKPRIPVISNVDAKPRRSRQCRTTHLPRPGV